MHEDEQRSTDLTKRIILDEFVSDPEKLQRVHLGLVERDRLARQRAAEADKRIAELSARVRGLERKAGETEQERASLKRRLADAHGALEAYRRETRRLKADLERVRGSRSMRIGRMLTRPAGLLRAKSATAPGVSKPEPVALPAATAAQVAAPEVPAPAPAIPPQTVSAPKPSQLSFEELEQQFARDPSSGVLNALLNRAWFARGDISRCERLIERHPELIAELPAKADELISRVLGEARLRDGRIALPSRAHGAAYRVEPGRVMYCVHSTPVFDSNGYSTRTRGLVDGLRENEVDVTVVSRLGYPWDMHPEAAPAQQERTVVAVGEVEYTHLPGADLNRDPLDEYILKAADAYTREARVRRPETIHAASNFRHALPALIAARRLGVPFVYEVRGLWELTEAAGKQDWEKSERFALQVDLETLVATEADHVLAITAQVRDELVARGVPAERIELAPNAVNEQEFVPLPLDRQYAQRMGIALDRPIIGFAGSVVAYEGLDTLLDAVRMLRDDDVAVQVVIAGSGAAEADLKSRTEELGLLEDVSFLGRVPATDIPRLMSLMDVMPCPRHSTTVTELVSPLKPLEALSSGKVVILSDVAPQADLIPPGSGRGFLVPAGDAAALAAQIQQVLDDRDLAIAAGRAGRLWIAGHRTWTVLARNVIGAYSRADHNRGAALEAVPHRPLDRVRVAVVADEFTTRTLAARIAIVPVPRDDPASALSDEIDAVFIESAWEGNAGEWSHGVGYYDDESFASLRALVDAAKSRGIPTVFWNKEDPVHVKRFLRAATACDHVFTTDAGLLSHYLSEGRDSVRTASALPFFADLSLHNPVQRPAGLDDEASVMYAGTYYGSRYAERSRELVSMLRCAVPIGLAIYDRQFDDPDSPYRFPAEFAHSVRGSLPYREVLAAYKSHLANLNVNSVADSPSMFSRRVVEVAASGGVVLSGPGRGVSETFGGAIPSSADPAFHRAHLSRWRNDPMSRLAEAWFQLRTVARAHTSDTALSILLRTAGIPVDGLQDPAYLALLPDGAPATVQAVLRQSAPPSAIAMPIADAADLADRLQLPVVDTDRADEAARELALDAVIQFDGAPRRTLAEDLLIASRFRGDARVTARESTALVDSRLLAIGTSDLDAIAGVGARIGELRSVIGDDGEGLELLLPPAPPVLPLTSDTEQTLTLGPRTVLIAGHDLKFVQPYVEALRAQGHEVLIDRWTAHNEHDEELSRSLLRRADVIWCEWGLGNAVWYSRHVSADQTLVIRVHLQELDLPYLRRVDAAKVDTFVFVGELIRRAAVESHSVPPERSLVIPNFVLGDALRRPKTEDARWTLGLVGIVPQRKRLDLAVDLIERLRAVDDRFRLRIKGHRPEEYHWMTDRPTEMAFYSEQYERIEAINERSGRDVVAFDPHDGNMADWYRGIGTVVSTSDFESFHLTLADGAASGSDAVSLAWAGADLIYPRSILFADIASMTDGVLDEGARARRLDDLREQVRSMDAPQVFDRFSKILLERVRA